MRLIHTSDWHLGQMFYEYDRAEEHARFLAWLLDTLDDQRADALVVSGDIFDHANPSAVSQKQLYGFLRDARRRLPFLNIVLIAGNHDSSGRLEAPSPLLCEFDITVVGQVIRRPDATVDGERLCVPLKDAHGKTAAWCLAVPFLRSADVPSVAAERIAPPACIGADTLRLAPLAQGQAGVADPDDLLGPDATARVGVVCGAAAAAVPSAVAYVAGVANVYQQALDCALTQRNGGRQPIVALGHCHVEGFAVSGDSERAIVAGGLDAISRHVFSPHLAYVALGHLHRPQQDPDDERIRYSGSPLPMSFSEIDYLHQVVAVDFDGDRLADMRALRVPRFADLIRLPSAPAALDGVAKAIEEHDFAVAEEGLRPYLEVRVQLDRPQPGLRARIEELLADKPVRLARVETSYARTAAERTDGAPRPTVDALTTLSEEEIFRQMYRAKYQQDTPDDLVLAFGELLREVNQEGQA